MGRKLKGPGELKVGKKFQYVDLPKNMEECYFDLELQEVKELDSGNIAFEWTVIDTDTKVKIDSTISSMLYPFQKLAEVYFWKELFAIAIALEGKELTQKRIDKKKAAYKKVQKAFMNNDEKYIGKRLRVSLKTRLNDDGETRTDKTWEPIEDDDDE